MTASTVRTPLLTPLGVHSVTIEDDFWTKRQTQIRMRTLRQQEQQLRKPGQQFDALKLTWKPGDPHEPHIFWESDVAKWIEAASYTIAQFPDPELEASVDEAIELLAGAQQDDGYLNTYFTVVKPGKRFTDLRDAHELYCAGHLIEAGVAHHLATGKNTLLDVVRRYADLIDKEFGPGGRCEGGYDGHQEIELALVRLYRVTGDRRYLELSYRLIKNRGVQPFYFDLERERRGDEGYFGDVFPFRPREEQLFREYNQSHQPVIEQDEAVGHAVRAVYMYSAMTDLALEFDDTELAAACDRLWEDVTGRKMYITGGIGSEPRIEGFGPAYDLPDEHGYAETCASVGMVMWAQRMLNSRQHGQYGDVLERALYNGVLAGASEEGTHYFYGNPLASNGTVHRHEWFGVACCPPNYARLIADVGRYAYSQGADRAAVNLFISSTARFELDNGTVTIRQRTTEPAGGTIQLTVQPHEGTQDFTLAVRVPGWATEPTAALNGEPLDLFSNTRDGYLNVTRTWTAGDVLNVELNPRPRRVWANRNVASAAGKVALAYGPFVYCLEGVDNAVPVRTVRLARYAKLTPRPDERTGTIGIHTHGSADTDRTELYALKPAEAVDEPLTAVPYFSWANRGQADMTVWIAEDS